MVIQIDTREKAKAIQKIVKTFDEHGVVHYASKLYVGDYMNLDNPRVIVDRKQNLLELCQNVCQGHQRFTAELKRAKDVGIKMIILCEHGRGVKSLEDVVNWENPRLKESPMVMSGERLYKVLVALSNRYGVEFVFCAKSQTGKKIIELLERQSVRTEDDPL